MADPQRRLLLFFCFGLHFYCCVHRTHAILRNVESLEIKGTSRAEDTTRATASSHFERWPVPKF